ncbi:glycosyltransferase family 2 protein [Telmatobacter bradus]|uniref:glycosyltransferase family 2 protein n=1 Tax=Telmatobacter bradus TaxID=474953 RepID=UPI003B4349AB
MIKNGTHKEVEFPSIGIVLTSYNTWDLARQCVEACFQHDYGNFQSILVYDDCSPQEQDVEFPEGTQVERGQVNLGFSRALNTAIRTRNEEIVLVFDADARPQTPFCARVRDAFSKDPDLGLVVMNTVGSRGQRTESYRPEEGAMSLILGQGLYAWWKKIFPEDSRRLSFFTCALAMRKEAFQEVQGFDEDFEFLDVDMDFSMRMNRSRWRVRVLDGPVVFHEGGGTKRTTRKRVLMFYKSRWQLLNKFGMIWNRPVVKWMILFRLRGEYWILRLLGRFLFKQRDVYEDKLIGREELIRFCQQNY